VAQTDDRIEADQQIGVRAPEQTPRLFGHRTQLKEALAAYDAGRMHSGLLIHGPRGIGKATFAFTLANKLLVRSSDEDKKRIFDQISAGVHPNLISLRVGRNPATGRFRTEISVDEVRAVIHRFQVSSGRVGTRICIIDSADDLNRNAANALLKTLEEPPANSYFMLVSQRPGVIIPTIHSRTVQLALRPLSSGDVKAAVCAALDDPVNETALDIACRQAAGRPRQALEELVSDNSSQVKELRNWLSEPHNRQGAGHVAIATDLARRDTGAYGKAMGVLTDWIAAQARSRALQFSPPDAPLAMLTGLWEKARALGADQATYNLDKRQTLTMIMDAIREIDRSG